VPPVRLDILNFKALGSKISKRCPFCRSDAEVRYQSYPSFFWVACKDCGAMAGIHTAVWPAIKAWHRRAKPMKISASEFKRGICRCNSCDYAHGRYRCEMRRQV
jgi:hypothetical protein